MYIEFGPMHNGVTYSGTMPVLNLANPTPDELVRAINTGIVKNRPMMERTFGNQYGFYAYDEDQSNYMYCIAQLEDSAFDIDLRRLAQYLRVLTHASHKNGLFGISVPLAPSNYNVLMDQFFRNPLRIEKFIKPYKNAENVLAERFVANSICDKIDFAFRLVPPVKHQDAYQAYPLFLIGVPMKPPLIGDQHVDETMESSLPHIIAVRTDMIRLSGKVKESA